MARRDPRNEPEASLHEALALEDPDTVAVASADNSNTPLPARLPVLPIRGVVVFPGTIVPLSVTREASRKLLDKHLPKSNLIALCTQRDEAQENPSPDDLYDMGTVATVLKLIRQPENEVSIIVHGLRRVTFPRFTQRKPHFIARVAEVEEHAPKNRKFEASVNQLRDQARELIELTPNAPDQALTVLMNITEPGNLADFLAANLNLDVQQRQDILEELDIAKRLRAVHRYVSSQLEILKLQLKIQADVQTSIGEVQRKVFLREQIKAIQKELGEDEEGFDPIVDSLRERLAQADLPEAVILEAGRELHRLESIPPASPEHALIVTYLETIADLPWNIASEDHMDLARAREILDRDHHGLQQVKRRLLEYLAVRRLNPEGKGPILCLVGPPGVGKTSLGHSIADALGRKFARLSLGGIRDEAEIRGHRRTYIGSMPGRIIQELRRAGTNNPVMMLDELDKLGADFRGDPSSALLEVLDPRQNNAFVDRYLDLPFDLSNVLFLCTANYIGNVPPALRDRLEIIDLPGYTDHDKLIIARKYLVPRQRKENGLTPRDIKFNAAGLRTLIDGYTREAGVRELERKVGSVCRAVAADVVRKLPGNGPRKVTKKKAARKTTRKPKQRLIDAVAVQGLLGAPEYQRDLDTRLSTPGVVIGLAYTPVGGEILFVEATCYPGKGNVTLTGQIGDVMKESATAALSLFKTRAPTPGMDYDISKLDELDLHIHVPAGAVPKDGPSAGVAMFTAIASLLLGRQSKQKLAMTGEITLRGRVLPIGGVKEKSLAAHRAGVRTILLPKQNEKDLEEVDDVVKKACKFIFINQVDELLDHALNK